MSQATTCKACGRAVYTNHVNEKNLCILCDPKSKFWNKDFTAIVDGPAAGPVDNAETVAPANMVAGAATVPTASSPVTVASAAPAATGKAGAPGTKGND